jgi:hypothetical protein
MQRLKDYCGIVAWQTGLGYLMLWAVTYWTLAEAGAVFGRSGVCHPDSAQVLFFWACDPSSPLAILANVANSALTVTVWAPIFVAAATVDPDAAIVAIPIVAVHVLGLPLGLLVVIRLSARTCDAVRALWRWALWRRTLRRRPHGATSAAGGQPPAAYPVETRLAETRL